jgi:hypothetical protein
LLLVLAELMAAAEAATQFLQHQAVTQHLELSPLLVVATAELPRATQPMVVPVAAAVMTFLVKGFLSVLQAKETLVVDLIKVVTALLVAVAVLVALVPMRLHNISEEPEALEFRQ